MDHKMDCQYYDGPFYDPFCFFNVQILVKIVLYIPGIKWDNSWAVGRCRVIRQRYSIRYSNKQMIKITGNSCRCLNSFIFYFSLFKN